MRRADLNFRRRGGLAGSLGLLSSHHSTRFTSKPVVPDNPYEIFAEEFIEPTLDPTPDWFRGVLNGFSIVFEVGKVASFTPVSLWLPRQCLSMVIANGPRIRKSRGGSKKL